MSAANLNRNFSDFQIEALVCACEYCDLDHETLSIPVARAFLKLVHSIPHKDRKTASVYSQRVGLLSREVWVLGRAEFERFSDHDEIRRLDRELAGIVAVIEHIRRELRAPLRRIEKGENTGSGE